jgi:hypothetical protein
VSKGGRRQRSAMDPPPAKVILVLPVRESEDIQVLAASCRRAAQSTSLTVVTYRTEVSRVTSSVERDRSLHMLGPTDAFQLYQALHRSPALVLAFTAVFVRRDPSKMPAVRRHLLTLERFVRYKATYFLVRAAPSVEEAFMAFSSWREVVRCGGEDDPRIIPFHSFNTDRDWLDLGTDVGDQEFCYRHGASNQRTDADNKTWDRPNRAAYHAMALQIVAGHRLPDGMHWDVGAGGSHKARLLAPHQVWKMSSSRAYLNVYPDAYVRAAKSATGVRPVWTSPSRSRSRST